MVDAFRLSCAYRGSSRITIKSVACLANTIGHVLGEQQAGDVVEEIIGASKKFRRQSTLAHEEEINAEGATFEEFVAAGLWSNSQPMGKPKITIMQFVDEIMQMWACIPVWELTGRSAVPRKDDAH